MVASSRSCFAVRVLVDEGLNHHRDLLLLRPWEFGGRFKQAAHSASRPGAGASLLLGLAQQFIHRNTQRPRHRRRQPRRNVARLAFIERERVLLQKFADYTRCYDNDQFITTTECGQNIFCNRTAQLG